MVKSQANSAFVKSIQSINEIINQNYKMLSKTDDLDLFFGKQGNN